MIVNFIPILSSYPELIILLNSDYSINRRGFLDFPLYDNEYQLSRCALDKISNTIYELYQIDSKLFSPLEDLTTEPNIIKINYINKYYGFLIYLNDDRIYYID